VPRPGLPGARLWAATERRCSSGGKAMAVFTNFPVTLPVTFSPTDIGCHSLYSLLCVAGKERGRGGVSGTVHILNDLGEPESDELTLQRLALPSALAWHPTEKVVVVGWINGEVVIWDVATNSLQELNGAHSMAVTTVTWSPGGSVLVTTDRAGKAALWSYSADAKTTKLQDLNIKSAATHCVFRPTAADEVSNLVGGAREGAQESATMFFIATDENKVMQYVDGKCTQCTTTHPKRITSLLFDSSRDTLVTLSEDLMVRQQAVSQTGKLPRPQEAKLSGMHLLNACWVGDGVLATACDDARLTVWSLEMMDNYILESGDRQPIISVAFSEQGKLLTAVTAVGSVWLWRHNGGPPSDGEKQWNSQQPINLDMNIEKVVMGGAGQGILAIQTSDGVDILKEYVMKCTYGGRTSVLQTASNRAIVEHNFSSSQELELEAPFSMKEIYATDRAVLFWSGRQARVYRLIREGAGPLQQAGDFKCEAAAVALMSDETIFAAQDDSVVGYSIQGVEKQALKVPDGKVAAVSVSGLFLVAASTAPSICIWDMSRAEPRTVAPQRPVGDSVDTILNVSINCNASRVSFLGRVGPAVDPSVWVWNVESNTVSSYSFEDSGLTPLSHFWDAGEPRMLAVEALPTSQEPSLKKEVTTFFSTAEEGLLVQHKYKFARNENTLSGIDVPHLFYGRLDTSIDSFGRGTDARVMSDFSGLVDTDAATKTAMIDFSYYLTLGNIDDAFKAVRAIKSAAVWETMARMCVATRRVDVAAYCLGKMGNAAGARALRAAANEYAEEEAQIATLAVHLGMNDDAEALLAECGRWDLLNKLYQSSGQWDKAIELAETKDRAHLRNTYHTAGKYQEACGHAEKAIEYYELSQTHLFEVPRLLADDPKALEQYILTPGDDPAKRQQASLLKWWGARLEALGVEELPKALEYYEKAEDALGQVRVLCCMEQYDKAKALVDNTGDRAAAYYLAQKFESMQADFSGDTGDHMILSGAIDKAIEYFSKSGCYNNAIRLAKETGQAKLIYGLAQRSTKKDMLDAAAYYEGEGQSIEKAVLLYHKGGRVGKALDLCFRHKMYEPLADISGDLDSSADPELLQRTAAFFRDNREYVMIHAPTAFCQPPCCDMAWLRV